MTLSLAHVDLRLGGKQILADVSLELHPGEVTGLVGPNGAGKTSLMRVLTRSVAATAGEVRLEGRALREYTRRSLAREVALVPQDLHVPFPFTVGELVLMGAAPRQPLFGFDGHDEVGFALAALERVGLEGFEDRSIDVLSGGERQLVLFARALVQDPTWLLLDEPTAFLDLRHRIEVLEIVRELAAEGKGVLVVSHDLALAARACDRLVVLSAGQIVADGPPSSVVHEELLAETFGIAAKIERASDGSPLIVPRLRDPGAR